MRRRHHNFLINGSEPIFITGFTLHSIIVILERLDKDKELRIFVETISNIPNFKTIYLDFSEERQIIKEKEILNLDFDDAYQYHAAKKIKASIITFDKDFEKIQDVIIFSPFEVVAKNFINK